MKQHLLLWDGDCGVCQELAQLLIKIDKKKLFRIIPHQQLSESQLAEMGLSREQCNTEVKLITKNGKILGGSLALNFILAYYKPWVFPIRIARRLPVLLQCEDYFYRAFARNRSTFSKLLNVKSCQVPPRAD